MPWNSCLFRKIHMPFTDRFMTQCLRFQERRQRGCGAGRLSLRRCRPPAGGLEGVVMRRAFSPACPSSAGPALRGEDTWGPLGPFPRALTADPCADPYAPPLRHPRASCCPVRRDEK